MKKTNLLLLLLAVVAMLSSCTKYAEEEIAPVLPSLAGGTVSQFKATNGEYSRAGINDEHKSIWHQGDNMTIVKFNPGQTTPQVIHAAALNSTISADGMVEGIP